VTLAGLQTQQQLEGCIQSEISSHGLLRPASLLRSDVPAALYGGGRMRQASKSEVALRPERAGELCGCTGDSVASSMVGSIFHDVPAGKRGPAFAHDAWIPAISRQEERKMPRCSYRTRSAEDYAQARLTHGGGDPNAHPHLLNCRHSSWNMMLKDHRAYVKLGAAGPNGTNPLAKQPTCGFGSANLYNQAHLAYDVSDIKALFYVNDTHTAERARVSGAVSADEAAELHDEAVNAATLAYVSLLRARTSVPELSRLPIMQFRVLPECYSHKDALRRVENGQRVGELPHNPVRSWSSGADSALQSVFEDPPVLGRPGEEFSLASLQRFPLRRNDVKCGTPLICSCGGLGNPVISQNECYSDSNLVVG